jgi:hypothetical protein
MVGAFVLTVSAFTALSRVGLISVGSLAASPRRIANGHVWLLFSSAIVVDRPVVASVVSFAALASVALLVCGSRVLWLSALLGHTCSTLLAYVGLGALQTLDAESFHSALVAPDYGVSAISAAWLGAIAASAWISRCRAPSQKAAVALACAGVALFAWMLRGDLTALDSEHVFAFAFGAAIAWRSALVTIRSPRIAMQTPTPAQ